MLSALQNLLASVYTWTSSRLKDHFDTIDVYFEEGEDTWKLNLDNITSISHTPHIANPPIPLSSLHQNKHFNPFSVANLWLQLLLINTFNGNFIRYGDFHDFYDPQDLQDQEVVNTTHYTPKLFITLLTPTQCAHLRELGTADDPPLHPSVIDMYCLMPYTSKIAGDELYKIIPSTMWPGSPFPLQRRLVPPISDPPPRTNEEWEAHPSIEEIDREYYHGMERMPPNWFKLTELWGGDSGVMYVVDVETGIAFEVDESRSERERWDWKKGEPMPIMKDWTVHEGTQMPVEALLKSWIEKFMDTRWIGVGEIELLVDERRDIIVLEMKLLLKEFGWPHAFPLRMERFKEFLVRAHEIQVREDTRQSAWFDLSRFLQRMDLQWKDRRAGKNNKDHPIYRDARLRIEYEGLWRVIGHHWRWQEEIAYCKAANEELHEEWTKSYSMQYINENGLKVAPEDVLRRWQELVDGNPEMKGAETELVQTLLDEAYEEYIKDGKPFSPEWYAERDRQMRENLERQARAAGWVPAEGSSEKVYGQDPTQTIASHMEL